MALPPSTETPRLRYLQNIVDAATDGGWADWPTPKETDYTQFGKIIVLFTYIDVSIRRIVEAAGNANCLDDKWEGRVGKLNIGEAEEAVLSLDWSDPNRIALNQIVERRGLRNLIAHFAVRRFPSDDAFLFFTKSDRDFKRQYGRDPEPGTIMTAIVECSQLNDGFRHIHKLQVWVTKAASEAELLFLKLSGNAAE
jgi:hypothetical protein